MANQWIECKPDRTLLDSAFEGYRLSLDKLPGYDVKLPKELCVVNIPMHQYSLQHVKTFTSHNHIIRDRWNSSILYFISQDLTVYSVADGKESSSLQTPAEVFQVSDELVLEGAGDLGDRYNPTITFPSETLAVVSIGNKNIIILETGVRTEQDYWKVINTGCEEHSLVLYDSILCSEEATPAIVLLTGHVEEQEDKKYCSVVSRTTYTQEANVGWTRSPDVWAYKTYNVEYTSLTSTGDIHIASSLYKFTDEEAVDKNEDAVEDMDNTDPKPPRYVWLQADDDITLTLALPAGAAKSDVEVVFSRNTLSVVVKGRQLLNGQLCRPIAPGESTWTIAGTGENTRLDVYISKQDPSWWTEFIVGDERGEMITDPDLAERIQQNLDYLTSEDMAIDEDKETPSSVDNQQLEDCDMMCSDATYLCRIPSGSQRPASVVNMSGNQWLFNMPPLGDAPSSFCTRHDVDGLVWSPSTADPLTPYKHIATFNALGYVQASKQNRRFISCPDDFSYVAIADTDRHVYVYRQPSTIDTDVRNRKTGRALQHVSKQQLISLDCTDSICGLASTNHAVYILTKHTLYKYKV